MATPQRPQGPGQQAQASQAPQAPQAQPQPGQHAPDPFKAMQDHMTALRQEALHVASCDELAAYLALLGQADAALHTLQGADQARKAEQADKERMVIGADDDADTDAPGHRPAGQSQPLPAAGASSSATVERDMRNVSRAEQRTEVDTDKG